MDVAAEVVLLAQDTPDPNQLLHGVVGGADDARGQEQPFDIVALVKLYGQVDHFLDAEAGAPNVAGAVIDAIRAVEHAEVGEQDLEQRDAAAVRRVGMTDAHPGRGTQAATIAGVAFGRARGGAGRIVLSGIGQDRELGWDRRHQLLRARDLLHSRARSSGMLARARSPACIRLPQAERRCRFLRTGCRRIGRPRQFNPTRCQSGSVGPSDRA